MSKRKDTKHPDFLGLQLLDDAIGAGARIAKNCNLDKVAQLDKRGGYRRVNQIRYDGGISAIIDVQRICDYQKILICSGIEFGDDPLEGGEGEVFEHEGFGASGGVGPAPGPGPGPFPGPAPPFFDPNLGPTAFANANPVGGASPLAVQFSSAGSFDPEGAPLLFSWNFGDGSPASNLPNPLHVYPNDGVFNAVLTVTDVEGATGVDGVQIIADTVVDILLAGTHGPSAPDEPNIIRTQDRGLNWTEVLRVPGMVEGPEFLDAAFFQGLFVGTVPRDGVAGETAIYRSANAVAWANVVMNGRDPVERPTRWLRATNGNQLLTFGFDALAAARYLYRSADAVAWIRGTNVLNGPVSCGPYVLSTDTVLLGTTNFLNLSRSVDLGDNWATQNLAGGNIQAFAQQSGGAVFAFQLGVAIQLSVDDGQNWVPLAGIVSPQVGITDAIAADDDSLIVVGTDAGGNFQISRSVDGGQTWVAVYNSPGGAARPQIRRSQDAFNRLWVFAGAVGPGSNTVLVSADNGQTWQVAAANPFYAPGTVVMRALVTKNEVIG